MSLIKNVLLGWLLVGGMVLYALLLTVSHAVRTVVDVVGFLGGEDTPSASNP